MGTTILLLISLAVDLGMGAAAYKHAVKVEGMVKKLDERVAKLE